MQIIDELMKYILDHSAYEITDVDSFYTEESERIMLKATPSEAEEFRYMDKSRSGTYSFDILAKNTNSQTAVAQLRTLETLLDLPSGFRIENDMEFSKCVVKKTATLIDVTDKLEKIYSSGFDLDYYIKYKK